MPIEPKALGWCPREKRNALFALYAFMRLIDNVSDEPGDLEVKRRGLARWRKMLDDAIAGDASGHAGDEEALCLSRWWEEMQAAENRTYFL